MSKQESVLCYKAAMAVFKKWLADGLMSADELRVIDTIIAEKYGLYSTSIYRENDLLCL